MNGFNVNSYISLGGLMLQILVTIVAVTNASADIKSDVAVLKMQINYLQQNQTDMKNQINEKVK